MGGVASHPAALLEKFSIQIFENSLALLKINILHHFFMEISPF
jgi:hypothetical protein